MSEPAEVLTDSDRIARDHAAADLARELRVDRSTAETLVEAGHRSAAEVRGLPDDTLLSLGLPTGAIDRIRQEGAPTSPGAGSAGPEGAQAVERWMATVRQAERPKRKLVVRPNDSTDVLRKWVDGDDRALEDWIGASSPPPSSGGEGATEDRVLADSFLDSEPESTVGGGLPISPTSATSASPIPSQLLEREATLVRWLTDLLDRVKSDQFDSATLLQEVQDIHRQLYDERSRVKQLEEELEHVKRGSIAVIKFVRSREARARDQALHEKDAEISELKLKLMTPGSLDDGSAPGPSTSSAPASADGSVEGAPDAARRLDEGLQQRSAAFVEREAELSRRIVQLEGEVRKLRGDAQARDQRDTLLREAPSKISTELEERIMKAELRERELSRRENEVRTKFEELRIHATELDHRQEGVTDRERQVSTAEETLARERVAAEAEAEKLAVSREAFGDTQKMIDASPELQQMREELLRLDSELKARDQLLLSKNQELEALQVRLSQLEQEFHPTDSAPSQASSGKIRSGVRRLDDLMFGGLPSGAQVLVNGPAHTGKEVLARLFIAEGLKQGIPGLWVVSDKTYLQIREEMTQLVPNYPTYEQQGMVRYVDLYSRSLGVSQADASVRLLSPTDKGVLDQILASVNSYSNEFKERAPTYRLVFESVSTVTAYLDTAQTLRFLQPFAGRRKLDTAASYYLLETGMHSESDLQTLEHMMDGSFHLKVEALKTFLSIRGLTEVQSRAWIGYTFTKKAFSLGSFSLDKIR